MMGLSKWIVLVMLFLPVVVAECPNDDDCKDIESWASENPSRIGEITDDGQFRAAWNLLDAVDPEQKQKLLSADNSIYDRLEGGQKEALMENPLTAQSCSTCVQNYASNSLTLENYGTVKETMLAFAQQEGAARNNPSAFGKIASMEAGGTAIFTKELLTDERFGVSLRQEGDIITLVGTDPGPPPEPIERILTDGELGGATYRSIQNGKLSDKSLSTEPEPDLLLSWQASIDDFNFGIRGGDSITNNYDGTYSFFGNGNEVTIHPHQVLDDGELIVSFDPATEILIASDTSVDAQIDDITFATRPGESLKDKINAPGTVRCALRKIFAQLYNDPEVICEESKPVFDNETLTALGQIAAQKGIPLDNIDTYEDAGDAYLEYLHEQAQAGTPLDLAAEKAAITNLEAATVLKELEDMSQRSRYATFRISNTAIEAQHKSILITPFYIIKIHSGEVIIDNDTITADDATIYWTISSYDEDYRTIEAQNVVKGSWTADLGENTIQSMHLQTGRLANYDADVYLRTFDETSATIDYLSDDVVHVTANGTGVSEIEFGRRWINGLLEHYLRGTVWELYFSSESIASGVDKNYARGLRDGRAVDNLTMYSSDALYAFRPQMYAVMSADRGTTVPKTICFSDNCTPQPNLLRVTDDYQNIISFGQMSNMELEYAWQDIEVYDPHQVQFAREDSNDYYGVFVSQELKEITESDQPELLARIDREAGDDLNIRESQTEHDVLFYMATQPASYAKASARLHSPSHGSTWLTFYSYRMDGRRILLLDENSYNTFIALAQEYGGKILTDTYGILHNTSVISYSIERDLSMRPLVYSNKITFTSPRQTREKYGSIA